MVFINNDSLVKHVVFRKFYICYIKTLTNVCIYIYISQLFVIYFFYQNRSKKRKSIMGKLFLVKIYSRFSEVHLQSAWGNKILIRDFDKRTNKTLDSTLNELCLKYSNTFREVRLTKNHLPNGEFFYYF